MKLKGKKKKRRVTTTSHTVVSNRTENIKASRRAKIKGAPTWTWDWLQRWGLRFPRRRSFLTVKAQIC